jgi:hypothetical protein
MDNPASPRLADTSEPISAMDRLRLWAVNVWWAIRKVPPKTLRGLRPVLHDDRRYETAQYVFKRDANGIQFARKREKKP